MKIIDDPKNSPNAESWHKEMLDELDWERKGRPYDEEMSSQINSNNQNTVTSDTPGIIAVLLLPVPVLVYGIPNSESRDSMANMAPSSIVDQSKFEACVYVDPTVVTQ